MRADKRKWFGSPVYLTPGADSGWSRGVLMKTIDGRLSVSTMRVSLRRHGLSRWVYESDGPRLVQAAGEDEKTFKRRVTLCLKGMAGDRRSADKAALMSL